MSNRNFPNITLTRAEQHLIVRNWKEVYSERGENVATAGVIQLVLDVLALMCRDATPGEFDLPTGVDLKTFDMKTFIATRTKDKKFDVNGLKHNGVKIAELIIQLVRQSDENEVTWLNRFQQFLVVILNNERASLLVVNTVIGLYTLAVALWVDTTTTENVKVQMEETFQFISKKIAESNTTVPTMDAIIETFFLQVTFSPHIIEVETVGSVRIVTKFLSYENVDVNCNALTQMIECGKAFDTENGRNWMRFCTKEGIVRELSKIITTISGIKLRKLALELACDIQRVVRNRNIFTEHELQHCVYSDNETVQKWSGELCRLMLRGTNTGVTKPSDVLIRATMLFMRFHNDYTKCPKRVVNTFFDEFSNWDAVFETVNSRLTNIEFMDALFSLVKRVIDRYRGEDNEEAKNKLRSFKHKAVQYISTLDRRYVIVYAHIIYAIVYSDTRLELINAEDCDILAEIVSEIFLDYFEDFAYQGNVITIFKILYDRSYISDAWKDKLDKFVDDRIALQQDLQDNLLEYVDLDQNENVCNTFMRLAIFAGQDIISKEKLIQICNESNILVMSMTGNQLNLEKNRVFLAYNLFVVVNSCVRMGPSALTTNKNVSVPELTTRLLDILQKTQNDFDFLVMAVFLCLSTLEITFRSISTTVNIKVLQQSLLKKISLISIENHNHIRYIEYMLKQIKMLILVKCDIDLRDIVLSFHKRFPDHDYAADLLKFCIRNDDSIMFIKCVIALLREISTKKLKKEFMQNIDKMLDKSQNRNMIWARLLRAGLNEFGSNVRASENHQSAKQLKQSGEVLRDFSFRYLPEVNNPTLPNLPSLIEDENQPTE